MGFVLFIHILASILLVVTILMQAGRGGGLAESFSSAENMFGTQTNTFLVRTTTILAVIFISTSLALAINGSKGEKSLMAVHKNELPKVAPVKAQEAEPSVSVKIEDPKPMQDINTVVNAAK